MNQRHENDPRGFRESELTIETRALADGNAEPEVYASVSSEAPYYRANLGKRGGYEVLGHAEGEIDFSRMKDGLVVQDTHWGDQIGIIRKPEIKNGKLGGVIEFGCGERAQEIKRDAIAGIRRNMSVGYFVSEYIEDGETEEGETVFRAVKWTPYEASFVNVPADTAVGVGRSINTAETTAAKPAAENKESQMDKEVKAETPAAEITKRGEGRAPSRRR